MDTTETAIQLASQVQELDLNCNEAGKVQELTGGDVTATEPAAAAADVSTNGLPAKFVGLGLKQEVIETLSSFGLEDLTSDQQAAIRSYTEKPDPVSLLESGTERAVTFLAKAAILQQVDPNTREQQVLILTPTRIAALQVTRVVRALGEEHGLKVRACIGGSPLFQDLQRLHAGVQIVAGTSGRLFHLMDRCVLNLSYLKVLVLENADQMLSDQRYDVYQIVKKLPSDVRIVLLSSSKSSDLIDSMKRLMTASPAEMESVKKVWDDKRREKQRRRSGSSEKGSLPVTAAAVTGEVKAEVVVDEGLAVASVSA